VVKNISNLENENKKLSKSRDRLKSLLDEKERSVSELQMEKAKLTGSQASFLCCFFYRILQVLKTGTDFQ
jgi:hypothetical protein